MQSDTFFSATIVTALVAVGAVAVTTLASPAGPAVFPQRQPAATAPVHVTLPTVIVVGKRDTTVAVGAEAPRPTRVQ